MSAHDLTLLIHILLFVYWLGGDLGVFYSSKFVIDPSLSRETRLIATKIMMGCDLVPRICMSLMLTVGGILTEFVGVEHPLWQMIGIVLLGPVWLSMVLILHYKHDASYIPALTKIDFYFRWLMIAGIIVSAAYSLSTGRLEETPWVAGKLLGFAFLIFCGLMIRIRLKGFVASYIKIVQDKYTEADNQIMINSLKKVRPWVLAIWAVLVVEAALGIVKPGSPLL
jgi:hypothetical protein